MTAPPMTREQKLAELAAIEASAEAARQEKAKRSFVYFLEAYVKIESDNPDPRKRGAIPFVLHDYQRERAIAWQDGEDEVILKARQLGFTWLAAAYALWTAAYHESSHVAIFSAGVREVRKVLRRVRFIHRRLPEALQAGGTLAVDSISFPNDSVITGFPSTEHAGIGETNRLVLFDEWAFHPYGEANLSAVLPTIAVSGQLIGMSTANPTLGPSGHFYEQWSAAVSGQSGVRPVFVPWSARPERDEAWLERERRTHIGSDQAFRAYYPSVPEDAFEGAEGLVYGVDVLGRMAWSKERIKEPPEPWAKCKWRIAGIDPGGRDPTAVLAVGVTEKDYAHVYGEMYRREPVGAIEISEYLAMLHSVAPLDLVLVDPSQASLVATLRSMGWNAHAANNEKLEGIALVRRLLLDGRLTVDKACANLINEFTGYWWPPREHLKAGGKASDTRTAAGHHADALDALRYITIGILKGLPRSQRQITQRWDDGSTPATFRQRQEARKKRVPGRMRRAI